MFPSIASSTSFNDGRREPTVTTVYRYGFSVAAVGVALALGHAAGTRTWREFALLLPFVAIAASAVFGGAGPGLIATALAGGAVMLLSAWGGPRSIDGHAVGLLLAQGILLSILGEGLLSMRRTARAGERTRRELERQILQIGEDERRRIGHDLHDGLGQHLTGISLLSESMAQQIGTGAASPAAQAETITRLVSEAVGWTRDLARNLWPATLERDGFVSAMEELSASASVLLRINCAWSHQGPPLSIEPERAIHLYRIVQEALNNSVKHGKAKSAAVSLNVAQHEMTLVVLDDGCGLSEKTRVNPGLGLQIMNYRANMIGASLAVERANKHGGTRVTCRCRINSATARSDQ